MRSGLEQQLRAERAAGGSASGSATVPPELLEKLGALGYCQNPGGSSDPKSAGADPKDKLEEYKTLNTEMRQGLIALREQRCARRGRPFPYARRARRRQLRGSLLSGPCPHRTETLEGSGGRVASSPRRNCRPTVPAYVAIVDSHIAMGDLPGALAAAHRGQGGRAA